MADTPQIYDQAVVLLDGKLVSDAAAVEISFTESDETITLLPMMSGTGLVVVAPGGRVMNVTVTELQPQKGQTFDLLATYLDNKRVELAIVLIGSGAKLTSSGFLRSPTFNGAVGAHFTKRWTFVGAPARFEGASEEAA